MSKQRNRRRSETSDQILELHDLEGSTFRARLIILVGLALLVVGLSMVIANFETVRDQQEELLDRLETPAAKPSPSEAPKA